jgi:hypothetical protein
MGKKDNQDHRRTGKDKAKQTFEKYGKYTNKHVRLMEMLRDKRETQTTIPAKEEKTTKEEKGKNKYNKKDKSSKKEE